MWLLLLMVLAVVNGFECMVMREGVGVLLDVSVV